MGVVYEARDVALGRRVALKVLAFDKALTARSAERFKREARMVADLEHPNIVPVYRVGDRGGVLFIAMKLVQGRSLDLLLAEQGALPVRVALHLLRSATRALAYAHERNIVHRDVKGANLLIDKDGRVLMSDFGVALRASDITLTMDGALIGTPAYMSPEQCTGKRAGPQSDQYSLGIVAFEALTGVVPFSSDTLAGYIQHHLYSPIPDLRIARDDLPPALLTILERVLEKDPNERYGSTREMLEAVEALPFSEADRRASEDTLSQLVHGANVERINTRELPALPDAATMMLTPRRPWWRQPAVWTGAGIGTVGLAAALVALGPFRDVPSDEVRAAVAETVAVVPDSVVPAPAPAPPPPPPPPGALRLLANPASAEILVDGRVIGVGSAVDVRLAAGQRRIGVRAIGFEPFDTSVTVDPGALVNLRRIVLHARPDST
jgi:hypothetical protein